MGALAVNTAGLGEAAWGTSLTVTKTPIWPPAHRSHLVFAVAGFVTNMSVKNLIEALRNAEYEISREEKESGTTTEGWMELRTLIDFA